MATQTGKKARKSGGTRFACKRSKARNSKKRTWGHLNFSVQAKNAESAVADNERLYEKVAVARRAKGFTDPDANVAVEV